MKLDLRDFIAESEKLGQVKKVDGADWNIEIGAICEIARHAVEYTPALLFDNIKDYPEGYRVLVNSVFSKERFGLAAGYPKEVCGSEVDLIQEWRRREKACAAIPPVYVEDSPLFENVLEGDDINLFQFPAPFWHELDGGRYIGTGSLTITKDPEEGWVNCGTYRVMLQGERELGFFMSNGKDSLIQRNKYIEAGKPCPVAISFGQHPLFLMAGSTHIAWGRSEYDYIGGLIGEPVEVIKGAYTGLPIPAHAEIVIEGEAVPGDSKIEGPFGEFTGYYGSGARPELLIRVKRLMYRNNPIILGSPPSKPPSDSSYFVSLIRSARMWNELEQMGIPDIKGLCSHIAGANMFLTAISIKQRYAGHAKQAALMASQVYAYLGRITIVVDEDIDPYDLKDVIWATCTRCDPAVDIDVIRNTWGGPLDPIHKDKKGFNNRIIIDATKPYDWIKEFPATVKVSPGKKQEIMEKWSGLMASLKD